MTNDSKILCSDTTKTATNISTGNTADPSQATGTLISTNISCSFVKSRKRNSGLSTITASTATATTTTTPITSKTPRRLSSDIATQDFYRSRLNPPLETANNGGSNLQEFIAVALAATTSKHSSKTQQKTPQQATSHNSCGASTRKKHLNRNRGGSGNNGHNNNATEVSTKSTLRHRLPKAVTLTPTALKVIAYSSIFFHFYIK